MIMLDYDYVINLFICLDMKIVFFWGGVIIKNLQSKNPQNILKVKIITNIGFIF